MTLPTVPSTLALRSAASTIAHPDLSGEALPGLPDASTTTRLMTFGVGTVTLTGIVRGPDGPVAGAIVHVERLLDDQLATRDATTDASGRYTLSGIEGGRLRVRAWRSPDAAGIENVVVFAAGTTTLDLAVKRFGGTEVQWAIAPTNPTEGMRVNLVVQVTTRAVGPSGLARVEPLSGVGVTITPIAALQIESLEPHLTDDAGRVLFTLSCNTVGASDLDVALATGERARLRPPACAPVTTTTTTLVAGVAPDVAPTVVVPVVTLAPVLIPVPVIAAAATTSLAR